MSTKLLNFTIGCVSVMLVAVMVLTNLIVFDLG